MKRRAGCRPTRFWTSRRPIPGGGRPHAGHEIPDAPEDAPFLAARVKWFDKAKGFGFANVFGQSDDVFVHVEVLRRFGLADLQAGEAVVMKVVDGPRGKLAAEVRSWDYV
jgi:CspA family cold shock protein